MNCQYCNKRYSNKSNFERHRKTSKKCLALQNERNNKFICETCNKELSNKFSLKRHYESCNKKRNLQTKVNNISTNIINNTTNNNINNNNINNITININHVDFMTFVNSGKIKEVFDANYSVSTLLGSNKSLADFTVNNLLLGDERPIYLCSDKQRSKFYFLNETNERIDDTNAQILIDSIIQHGFDSIKRSYKNHLYKIKEPPQELTDAFKKIMNLNSERKEYIKRLLETLPTTIKERCIRDRNLLLLRIQEEKNRNESEEIIEIKEEDDEESTPKEVKEDDEEAPKEIKKMYDENDEYQLIGNVLLSDLRRYKMYYLSTGKIALPVEFVKNQESLNLYKNYLQT